MHIFLSYPSELKSIAEPIAFSLRGRGHRIFFDKDDLPPGSSYDDKIQTAIEQSDMLVFLISPASVTKGRYTLTEIEFARKTWSCPNNRVLPVLIEPTELRAIPSFLKGVEILEPKGNVSAEVAAAIERLRGTDLQLRVALKGATIAAVGVVATLSALELLTPVLDLGLPSKLMLAGLFLVLPFSALLMFFKQRLSWRIFTPVVTLGVAYALASPFFLDGASAHLISSLEYSELLPSPMIEKAIPSAPAALPSETNQFLLKQQALLEHLARENYWIDKANSFLSMNIWGTIMAMGLLIGLWASMSGLADPNRWFCVLAVGAIAAPISLEFGLLLYRALSPSAGFSGGAAFYYAALGGLVSYFYARGAGRYG
jgi:hypothetical protein